MYNYENDAISIRSSKYEIMRRLNSYDHKVIEDITCIEHLNICAISYEHCNGWFFNYDGSLWFTLAPHTRADITKHSITGLDHEVCLK